MLSLHMNCLVLSRFLVAAVFVAMSGRGSAAESYSEAKFTMAVGRMVRAGVREISDLGAHVSSPKGETTEAVLVQLRSEWQKFSWSQKKEFVVIALTKCDIQGGSSVLLLQLVGKEGVPLRQELQTIPDSVLADRMGMNKEAIESFRARLAFFADK
jgi:hypothetical protein